MLSNSCFLNGVSPSVLYVWKRKLFENGCAETVTEDREETLEELLKQNAELKEDIQRLEQQRKVLEKDVHRLQLERDVLEKAGEILKKEEGVNQLEEDIANDQLSLKEFTDPFTGEPVK